MAVTPIGTRSSSARLRGAHRLATSSAAASGIPSSVENVAHAGLPVRAWLGLESQRDSLRAMWRAVGDVELVGRVDVGLPAAGLPALDPSVGDPQDRAFRIGVLLAVRRFGGAVHHRHPGQPAAATAASRVGVGIVDDDEQVLDTASSSAPNGGRSSSAGASSDRSSAASVGQVAGRARAVDCTGNIVVRQPLQPRPVVALEVRGQPARLRGRRGRAM